MASVSNGGKRISPNGISMRLAFTYHSLWCSSSNPTQWRALDLYGTCGAHSFCPASPQPLPSSLEILRLQWNGWQIRAVWNYELEEESNVDWVWRLLVSSRRNVLWQNIYIYIYIYIYIHILILVRHYLMCF